MAPLFYLADEAVTINLPLPSLQHIAIVRFVVNAWMQHDIHESLEEIRFTVESEPDDLKPRWMKIENEVRSRIQNLSLPAALEEKALSIVKAIGIQLLKWKEYHEIRGNDSNNSKVGLPKVVYWTMYGTINKFRTAQTLVEDCDVDVVVRLQFACAYCLENSIQQLWKDVDQHESPDFLLKRKDSKWFPLFQFWYEVMKQGLTADELLKKEAFHNMFEVVIYDANEAAIEYFLEKMTTAQKRKTFNTIGYFSDKFRFTASGEYRNETIFLVFSQLNKCQQKKYLKAFSFGVLICFLSWPFQDLFMKVAVYLLRFMPDYGAKIVIKSWCFKVSDGYKDYNYLQLFSEFWQMCSAGQKRYVIERCSEGWELLLDLFMCGEKEPLQLILRDANRREQKDIIDYYEDEGYCSFYSEKYCHHGYDEKKVEEMWHEFLCYLKDVIREVCSKGGRKGRKTKIVSNARNNQPSKLRCLRNRKIT